MALPLANNVPPKDPLDVLPYQFNWANFLAAGETITSATITVPTGITLFLPAVVNGPIVNFYLSGGTNGNGSSVSSSVAISIYVSPSSAARAVRMAS